MIGQIDNSICTPGKWRRIAGNKVFTLADADHQRTAESRGDHQVGLVHRREELVLKPCGPLAYRPILQDLSGVEWRDEIDVRVVSVDHEANEFEAELIAKRSTPQYGAVD